MDTVLILSNPLFLFLLWIFFIIIAEEKEDALLCWLQMVFGLPLGIYLLYIGSTTNVIPSITGVGVICISIFYVFLGTYFALKFGIRNFDKNK